MRACASVVDGSKLLVVYFRQFMYACAFRVEKLVTRERVLSNTQLRVCARARVLSIIKSLKSESRKIM